MSAKNHTPRGATRDVELLAAYLSANYPGLREENIGCNEPDVRAVWIAKARAWHKDQTATGFRAALREFKQLHGVRHWSRETTLKHAIKALKKAGMM